MCHKRKQYSPQFKVKVALEAVRGEKTISELASQDEVHPTLTNTWKRQLGAEASHLFEQGSKASQRHESQQSEIDELYRQIGKLKVERDFLASRSAQLGLKSAKPWL